jgi:curved DNA-binding protein CbpA
VEKAYHFFASMYDDAAVAMYSLLDVEEQREARARIRQAYEVLRDPQQREQYDRSLAGQAAPGPTQAPSLPSALEVATASVVAPVPPVAPSAAPPSPEPGGEPPAPRLVFLPEPVTGESLKKAREERRVSLHEIAGATKIGVRFLEYIEADRHADLPAVVYIRGFVQQYARYIGLEPRQTAESYLKRVRS